MRFDDLETVEIDNLAQALRLLADPARLRALRVLSREELSAGEVAQVLSVAASTTSKHLAALRDAGLIEERRDGRHAFFRVTAAARTDSRWAATLERLPDEPDDAGDLPRLDHVLRARREARAEGDGARTFVPGRSWTAWARALTVLVPPGLRVLDLGCGDGALSIEMGRFAARVVGIDRREASVRTARAAAERRRMAHVTFETGDAESPPAEPGAWDVVVFSQVLHAVDDPQRALKAARTALAAGGRVLVLDLLRHREAWTADRLGHRRQGFATSELAALLTTAGFRDARVERVAGRAGDPFKVLLATGVRAAGTRAVKPREKKR